MVARRAHNPEVGGPSPPSATKQEVNPNGWPLIVFPPHISSHHIQQPITHLFKYRNSETNLQIQLALHPSAHKNPNFVLETPKIPEKSPILTQKCRFCARNARKRGFRRAKAHKNPDFVLEMPENGGSAAQKSTKTSILCSKRPKTGVPKAKKAQKPRFCARNALKWGFRTAKAHKNLDFVLEMPEIGGPEGKKRTKKPFLCSRRE